MIAAQPHASTIMKSLRCSSTYSMSASSPSLTLQCCSSAGWCAISEDHCLNYCVGGPCWKPPPPAARTSAASDGASAPVEATGSPKGPRRQGAQGARAPKARAPKPDAPKARAPKPDASKPRARKPRGRKGEAEGQ